MRHSIGQSVHPPASKRASSASTSRPAASPRPRSAPTAACRFGARDRARSLPGVFREGEVGRPRGARGGAQGALRRAQALDERPPRDRQPAGRRPDAAPAAIENATSSRPRSASRPRSTIPMPLDQAVLDWQVVGHRTTENGEPPDRRRRRRGAPRHDQLAARGGRRSAGLRPVGIDLSAFGMIRALRRRARRGRRADFVAAPHSRLRGARRPAGRRRTAVPGRRPAAPAAGAALLQPRRRHQPRRRPQGALPLHPHLAVRDRGHRPAARRAPRADPRARAPVARPRRPRGAGRGDRGRSGDRRRDPRGARGGRRASSPTSSGSRSSTTAPRRAPSRSRGSSPAARGRRSPGSSSGSSATSATRSAVGRPTALGGLDDAGRRPPDRSPTASPWRASRCAPST